MGEYLKNSEIFLNDSFLVKGGTSNKNLDIILFAYSRGVGKSCCSRPKDTQVMCICLRHIEAIDFSSQILPLYAVKKGDKRTNLPSK